MLEWMYFDIADGKLQGGILLVRNSITNHISSLWGIHVFRRSQHMGAPGS